MIAPRLASAALAFLFLTTSLVALAPTTLAHTCTAEVPEQTPDPDHCNGHDCSTGDPSAGIGIHSHIVYHNENEGRKIHGCGPLLHAGVDGQGSMYVCLADDVCLETLVDSCKKVCSEAGRLGLA